MLGGGVNKLEYNKEREERSRGMIMIVRDKGGGGELRREYNNQYMEYDSQYMTYERERQRDRERGREREERDKEREKERDREIER